MSQPTHNMWTLSLGLPCQEESRHSCAPDRVCPNHSQLQETWNSFPAIGSLLHLSHSISYFSETLILIHYWSTQKFLEVHSEFRIKSKFFNIMFMVYFLPTSLYNPKHTRHIPETTLSITPLTSIWSIPPLAPVPGQAPISSTIPSQSLHLAMISFPPKFSQGLILLITIITQDDSLNIVSSQYLLFSRAQYLKTNSQKHFSELSQLYTITMGKTTSQLKFFRGGSFPLSAVPTHLQPPPHLND